MPAEMLIERQDVHKDERYEHEDGDYARPPIPCQHGKHGEGYKFPEIVYVLCVAKCTTGVELAEIFLHAPSIVCELVQSLLSNTTLR